MLNKKCNADEIENLINSAKSGEICKLENKEYYLSRRVVIKNKENIIIDGQGSKIITKYVNYDDFTKSTDAFLIEDSKAVTLKNFVFDTDVPTNITAVIEDIYELNETESAVIIKVDDCYNINGNEVLMAFDSADSDGSFDYKFHKYSLHKNNKNIVTYMQDEIIVFNTYAGLKNDYLGDNRFKLYMLTKEITKATVGIRFCVRHTMYGSSVITVRNSDDTVIKDITMHSTPGMGIIVLARSNNMVVDGLKIIKAEGSHTLMAGNCDGIHLAGLTGKFVMKNCVYDGLGDDALNVHATAGTITGIDLDNKTLKVNYCKKFEDGVLPKRWCQKGDEIRVFNPENLEHIATFTVEEFEDERLKFSDLKGKLEKGFMIQNAVFTPACEVDNCVMRNTRARGLLFQTENVEVKNCEIYGISSSGILAAPAFEQWYEVGPVHNMYIHNNKFIKCGFVNGKEAVFVGSNHNSADIKVWHLHSNIRVEDNVFEDCPGTQISIAATDGVAIKSNVFKNRQNDENNIKTQNCTEVEIN